MYITEMNNVTAALESFVFASMVGRVIFSSVALCGKEQIAIELSPLNHSIWRDYIM